MSNPPFFSIITPTYNRAHYLPEMIESVQQQAFDNYEHIIVDDGSEDDTEIIVSEKVKADSRIKYIKQTNKGRSIARNVGIKAAQGEYICFLDSDDVWSNNYLSSLNKSIKKTSSDFLVTRMVWFQKSKDTISEREIESFSAQNLEEIIRQEIGMNACIKSNLFDNQLFNPSLVINEDFELWIRMLCYSSTVVKAVPDAHYIVDVPNEVGVHTSEVLYEMEKTQAEIKSTPNVEKRITRSFWNARKKSILRLKIRAFERESRQTKLLVSILAYLMRYPLERHNLSLLVTFIYALPGGSIIKRWKQG